MSQKPPFEFSEEELETSIDAFRYTSAPRLNRDRKRATQAPRRPRGNAASNGDTGESQHGGDKNSSGT